MGRTNLDLLMTFPDGSHLVIRPQCCPTAPKQHLAPDLSAFAIAESGGDQMKVRYPDSNVTDSLR